MAFSFELQIENLDAIREAYLEAPTIAEGWLQQALIQTNAILMSNAVPPNVPYRTGQLSETFFELISGLTSVMGPTVSYAAAVQFGVSASPGRYVPAIGKRLINKDRKDGKPRKDFGMWPGFTGRRYMEKIMVASTEAVNTTFEEALNGMISDIARISSL